MPITARLKAQAADALIRLPDLTPAARRVGLELLNHADRKSGVSWPSEARMAEALGVDTRTIRRGKAALRAAGLLTWEQRGHHRTPIYRLLWDRLVQLAAAIKARVQAACQAARKATKAKPSTPPPSPPPLNKRPENGPARSTGRTFPPAYPTHQGFKMACEGKEAASAAPLRGQITDRELDARASARFWTALRALGPQIMAQFIAHPRADELQDAAIRAERFRPDQGRTGIATLHQLLQGSTT